MTNNVRYTYIVDDTVGKVYQVVLNKTNKIGDTKYNFWCRSPYP